MRSPTQAAPGFPARFTQLRLQAGLTKTALAAPRYTVSYVSQIEAGRRRPSAKALQFFAGRLGVTKRHLLTGIPDGLEERLEYELEQSRLLLAQGNPDEAHRVAGGVIRDSEGLGLNRQRALAHLIRGEALVRLGRVRDALENLEKALGGELPDRERALGTAALARGYAALGDLSFALDLVESFLKEPGDVALEPVVVAEMHTVLVSVYFERGDMVRAERAAERALAAVDEGTDPLVRANAYWSAGRVLAEKKRWDEALELVTHARILIEDLKDQRRLAAVHNAYAFLCLEIEPPKIDEARHHLDAAEALFRDSASSAELAYLWTERSRLALLEERPEDALDYALRAGQAAGQDSLERGRALFLRSRALAELGRRPRAIESFREAAEVFRKAGARQQEASCWREVGELELQSGDVDAGLRAFRAGLELLEPRRSRA